MLSDMPNSPLWGQTILHFYQQYINVAFFTASKKTLSHFLDFPLARKKFALQVSSAFLFEMLFKDLHFFSVTCLFISLFPTHRLTYLNRPISAPYLLFKPLLTLTLNYCTSHTAGLPASTLVGLIVNSHTTASPIFF